MTEVNQKKVNVDDPVDSLFTAFTIALARSARRGKLENSEGELIIIEASELVQNMLKVGNGAFRVQMDGPLFGEATADEKAKMI